MNPLFLSYDVSSISQYIRFAFEMLVQYRDECIFPLRIKMMCMCTTKRKEKTLVEFELGLGLALPWTHLYPPPLAKKRANHPLSFPLSHSLAPLSYLQ